MASRLDRLLEQGGCGEHRLSRHGSRQAGERKPGNARVVRQPQTRQRHRRAIRIGKAQAGGRQPPARREQMQGEFQPALVLWRDQAAKGLAGEARAILAKALPKRARRERNAPIGIDL